MSRNLPARPNLEYLKNEAKDRLADLRARDPRAQLSDAQFALANEYGFASWPKLKEHVEQAAATIQHPLAGGWIADVARSKRHPANQFRSARIHFAVRGTTIEIVDEYVDESGRAARGRNTIEADGVERAVSNGYAIAATLGPRRLATVARKDGEVVGGGTYTVSPDGQTLTIADEGAESLIVLNRV
ncbi:MAG TPA: hypothetical protein VFZ31_11575 [Vicinamibacterales bacterium]